MTETAADLKYWAFISYSHADEAWARWLHTSLETWKVPPRLVGRPLGNEAVPARLFPVFRDRDELPSSHELGAVIERALRQSRNLIVICSPRSATSRWVNEEIRAFRALGRSDRVFCLIVDGEPHASNAPTLAHLECFPPALRTEGFEPIAADAREGKDGKAGAKLKLLAGVLGIGLDELKQREKQRQFRQRLLNTGLALAVLAALGGTVQWFLAKRADRERQIVTERLVDQGRLELLDGHQARAAVLLTEALKRGYDTVPLRFMLGQAMLPVDALTNVRVKHGGKTVRRALFSPDGAQFLLVTDLGAETVAKLYDAGSGAERRVLKKVPAAPLRVQFLGKGERLLVHGAASADALASGQCTTSMWSLAAPEPVFERAGSCGAAGTPASTDGAIAVGTASGVIVVDATTGHELRTVEKGHAFGALSYSTDGRWLATANAKGQVEARAVGDYRVMLTLDGFAGQAVTGLEFTPDSTRLLALSQYGDIRIWDLSTGALAVAFGADPAGVTSVAFNADGRRLLTIGTEGYKVWSAGRGILLFSKKLPLYADSAAALSGDGEFLYLADDTSSIAEIWAVRSGTRLQTLDFHSNGVSAISLDGDGNRLLLASKDGAAELWNAHTNPLAMIDSGGRAISRTLWLDDRRLLVAGGDYGAGWLAIVDGRTGKVVGTLDGHVNYVQDAVLSNDRKVLVTVGADGKAGIWSAADGKRIALLDVATIGLSGASLSHDGSRALLRFAAIESGNAGALLDIAKAEIVARLPNVAPLQGSAFSDDGKHLASVDVSGGAKLWDPDKGTLLAAFAAHTGESARPVFDHAGTRFMTSGQDHAVRIWPTEGGESLAKIEEPSLGWVESAIFSPDEAQVAFGTTTGNIWLWNPVTQAAQALKGFTSSIGDLQYLHEGRVLVTMAYDGTIRAWDAAKGEPLGLIAALGGNASPQASPSETLIAAGSAASRLGGVWFTGLERRSVTELAKELQCRVPWQLVGEVLTQAAVTTGTCP